MARPTQDKDCRRSKTEWAGTFQDTASFESYQELKETKRQQLVKRSASKEETNGKHAQKRNQDGRKIRGCHENVMSFN